MLTDIKDHHDEIEFSCYVVALLHLWCILKGLLDHFMQSRVLMLNGNLHDQSDRSADKIRPFCSNTRFCGWGPFTVACVDVLEATQLVGFVHCEHGMLA